jgi:hypothetical protein
MKKSILIGSGILLLVLLLGGAAFVGGRILNGQGLPEVAGGGGQGGMRIGTNGGPTVSLDIEPSAELPQTPAEARGLFDHRQDNSIFVGTGQVTMMVQRDESGNASSSSDHDGPTVEVVVTSQTVVYRDVTMKQFDGPPPAGEKIQQVLEPGELDEIGKDSLLAAWGKKTGDRIIADVLVYSPPSVMFKR